MVHVFGRQDLGDLHEDCVEEGEEGENGALFAVAKHLDEAQTLLRGLDAGGELFQTNLANFEQIFEPKDHLSVHEDLLEQLQNHHFNQVAGRQTHLLTQQKLLDDYEQRLDSVVPVLLVSFVQNALINGLQQLAHDVGLVDEFGVFFDQEFDPRNGPEVLPGVFDLLRQKLSVLGGDMAEEELFLHVHFRH